MNSIDLSLQIAKQTHLSKNQIQSVLNLLSEGATIPFIARYRKDQTGGLEDHEIFTIQKEGIAIEELTKRKKYILASLEDQGIKEVQLLSKIEKCWNKKELEDLFSPYKSKRKTKASIAKENGLEGLAKIIMAQKGDVVNAQSFVKNKVKNKDEAIAGALDIISEWILEHPFSKSQIRKTFSREGMLTSKVKKGKEQEAQVYKTYFEFGQKATKTPSHRVLAILRGTAEGLLSSSISIDKKAAITQLERIFIKGNNQASTLVKTAITNTYSKNLKPSLEKELINEIKLKSDIDAIKVFSKNLEQLLLEAPAGKKNILAIDPGFKSGCKVVCINRQGDLLTDTVIYPHPPQNQLEKSKNSILKLIKQHKTEAIAIGNGTAGRETESFIKTLNLPEEIAIYLVNENGASIYSASEIGREEFPNHDITVRGSVSIGRRLMDPLAELVKIDPKSIGVGQYQHDVDQNLLKTELDHIVERCVNKIGIQLNTASQYLLQYTAGIGPTIAKNIIEYRTKNGKFTNLNQLTKVPRLGDKAFEQCAGFLRLQGDNPLDNTGIHPDQYKLVHQIAKQLNITVEKLIGNKEILELSTNQNLQNQIGALTLADIINELAKPNIDPRTKEDQFQFDKNITSINNLYEGMTLQGKVSNITNFGAFIDLGIKENGLLHISQITDKFISSPNEILHLNQVVTVKIILLDLDNKKISLSIKDAI